MRGKKEHVILSNDEQEQLITLSRKQNAPYRLVMRAKLILMSRVSDILYKRISFN
jgi:hypothetical protein